MFICIFLIAGSGTMQGQVPETINYQAALRDDSGQALNNQTVSLRLTVRQATADGSPVYAETHAVQTNDRGIVQLGIGTGSNPIGALSAISWGTDAYFLQIEMDDAGGNDFTWLGTSQLVTVPYAFFSNNGVQFNPDLECSESTEGMIRYNYDSKTLELCNGTSWAALGQGSTGDWQCGQLLVDARDGQSYGTIQLGGQCWMADNLNYGVYAESIFTNEDHSDVSNNGVVEKYALDNEEGNFEIYGGLYDWNEMMNYSSVESSRGICPEGWHVPSFDEWNVLEEFVGGALIAGKALKAGGTSGFNFRLSGGRTAKGLFTGQGESTGSLWTSTASASHPDTRAYNRNFIDDADNIQHNSDVMVTGKSVRCVKD